MILIYSSNLKVNSIIVVWSLGFHTLHETNLEFYYYSVSYHIFIHGLLPNVGHQYMSFDGDLRGPYA